jgi:hypothetical protein
MLAAPASVMGIDAATLRVWISMISTCMIRCFRKEAIGKGAPGIAGRRQFFLEGIVRAFVARPGKSAIIAQIARAASKATRPAYSPHDLARGSTIQRQ